MLELLLVLHFVSFVGAFRILLVPIQMQSHSACMSSIALSLDARGHQVHILTGKDYKLPSEISSSKALTVERYERPELETPSDIKAFYDNITKMILEDKADPGIVLKYVSPLMAAECRRLLLHNEPLMSRLSDLHFDLAVIDGLFLMKCLYLVPHRLGIPWVTMTDSFEPLVARVPWLPSFVSSSHLPLTDRMNFKERLQNTILSIFIALVPVVPEPADNVISTYRTFGHFDRLDDLAAKTLLWILTSDTSLDYARPMMPNMIEAGGLTTKPSTGELSEPVKSFIENADKGIILVSFGSAVSKLPPLIAEKFISAFTRIKNYRIIWRMENIPGIKFPENILVLDWIPQNDILAHPKTKLFITHCGNNGQYESLYHGVPMIGFPFNGDQPYNGKRIIYKGFGLAMDIHDFTADELISNINRILSDDSFKNRISKASEIFRSAPQTSSGKAAWWIEHVTKFGGSHLRSAGNDLPLYQYFMLDILVFLLGFFVLLSVLMWKILNIILRKILNRPKKQDKKKRQ